MRRVPGSDRTSIEIGTVRYEKQVKYGLMITANLVLFYFLYRWVQDSIRWDSLKTAILDTPFSAVATALIIGLILLLMYGQRLAYLISREFSPCFWIVCYGFGANSVLPFRIGDALKLYFARRYFEVSAAKLLFVKVMEKFFDLSFLLIIGVLAVLYGVLAVDKAPLLLIAGLLVTLLAATTIVFFLIRKDSRFMAILRQYALLDHLLNMFEEAITSPAKKKAIAVSALIWVTTVTMIFIYYSLALPGFDIGWNDALALVFVTTISLGIPSAPGALGVFEAAIVFYLTKFVGVAASQALATALVLHLLIALPQIALMIAALLVARHRLRESHRLPSS